MLNTIYLRRKNKIILDKGSNKLPVTVLSTLNKNLESLGYTLSKGVLTRLRTLDLPVVEKFYLQLVTDLKAMKGVRAFNPMYPNFPTQVMKASEAELYINAVFHYLSAFVSDLTGGETAVWLPKYNKKERLPLLDNVKLTVIELGTQKEFDQIFTNLMSSKTSISDTDKADLKWYLEAASSRNKSVLPEAIPNKEILAFVGAQVLNNPLRALGINNLSRYFKTATDVLRLAVGMSDGDVSLATPTKFRNFKRGERKALLALLNKSGSLDNIKEDMLRWKSRWLVLAKHLHAGDYSKNFALASRAISTLRNDVKSIETFNSKVESAISNEEITEVVSLLKDRAGVFARRLDQLLRTKATIRTVNAFEKVADDVSTPVLLQVMAHFKNRNTENDLRVFFPKGNLAKVQAIKNELPPINKKYCAAVVNVCASTLKTRFKKLPKLGSCHVSEDLKNYLVPFSQRSASKSLRTLVRGSQIPFGDEKDTVRFFIWWHESANGKSIGRVDLDLSAVMFDKDWNSKGNVSYFNLRYDSRSQDEFISVHSGDITSAPKGACEFIDVDIPKMLASGTRYIAMSVNSFTGQAFNAIPEAQAGWMLREFPNSGEVFEARTITDKLDLTNESKICVPMVLDLQERKIIWMDMGIKKNSLYVNNVRGNLNSTAIVARAFTQLAKPNLYDLFKLHAEARGRVVKSADKAKTLFTSENAFEIERISAEYL